MTARGRTVPGRHAIGDCFPAGGIWILATPISSVGPYRRLRYRMPIRYRRFAPSISYVDSEGVRYRRSYCSISKMTKPSMSKVMNRDVGIEVSCLRYRTNIIRYRILILYTISKVFLTFDIEGYVIKYRGRYRKRYNIHPMSFTAERKLPLPRLHHAGAEESQRHESLFLRNSTA